MNPFCKRPFDHFFSDAFQMMQPCCIAHCKHPYKNNDDAQFNAVHLSEGVYEFYTSEQMKQLRSDMLKDDPLTPLVKDVCRNCIEMEEKGLPSLRKPLGEVDLLGRVLEIKMKIFGNKCNLRCYMCNLKNSSTRQQQAEKLIEYNPKVSEFLEYDQVQKFNDEIGGFDLSINNPDLFNRIIEDFKKLSKRIRTFTIYGGEPFIIESHYRLLDAMIEVGEAENISLNYDSNLTVLQWSKYKIIDYINKFSNVVLSWSVEGYGKYNDYIRYPSNWDTIASNLQEIRPHVNKLKASITLSSLSVLHLDKLIDYLQDNSIDYTFNYVLTPVVCSLKSLHPNIRKRLSKKYKDTNLDFLCEDLMEEVSDWEQRWSDMLEYLDAIDHVNKTNWKETFPELCDLSEDW